jgi:uncharacterized protein (DUF4415 family)
MPRKIAKRVVDRDNPEWTKADFARARSPEAVLSPKTLAAFKPHRGPQKTPTKVPVSIRLSPNVVRYFKAGGPGWQARIDEVLQKVTRRRSATSKRKTKAA